MNSTVIQIRYGGKYGGSAGCTTVRLPAWLEEAPLTKIKGFMKLAAQHSREFDNPGEIIRLESYLTGAIAEAEAELQVAKSINNEKTHKAEVKRVENWINRLRKIRESLTAALDEYNPTRKNDQGGK